VLQFSISMNPLRAAVLVNLQIARRYADHPKAAWRSLFRSNGKLDEKHQKNDGKEKLLHRAFIFQCFCLSSLLPFCALAGWRRPRPLPRCFQAWKWLRPRALAQGGDLLRQTPELCGFYQRFIFQGIDPHACSLAKQPGRETFTHSDQYSPHQGRYN